MGRIEDLQARLEREPRSRLFAQLAEELRKSGQLDEAIRTCRIGLAHHPSYALARITLARALLDTGNGRGARSELERVLAAIPENIMAGRLLGECLESLGEVDAARDQYEKTLALAPGDAQLTERLRALVQEKAAGDTTGTVEVEAAQALPAEASARERAADPLPPEAPSPFTIPFRDREARPEEVTAAPLHPEGLGREPARAQPEPPTPASPPVERAPEGASAPLTHGPETLAPGPLPSGIGSLPPPSRTTPEPGRASSGSGSQEDASTYTLPVGTPRPVIEGTEVGGFSGFRAEALRQAAARAEAESHDGEIVSATLAELYLRQGFPDKAVDVYRQLVARDPSNHEVRRRLDELTAEPPEGAAGTGSVEFQGVTTALQRLESFLSAVRRNRR